MNKFVAKMLMVAILLNVWFASASHYRYGTLNWQATGGGTNGRMVTFTVTSAWRASAFSGVVVGGTVSVGTSLRPVEFQTPAFAVVHTVSVVNSAADWFIGSSDIDYEYAADGTYMSEVSENCCRIGSLVNNANGDFRLTSQVVVQASMARQGIVTTIAPIVTVTFNQLNMFMLPTLSPDDPFIRFYIATADQAAGVGEAFTPISGLTIDAETGVVSWFAGTSGLHSTHFIIEGYASQADADARMNVVSTTSVDFIIDSGTPTGNVPEFSQITQAGMNVAFDAMSNDNVIVVLQDGETLDLTVYATDADSADTVTLTPTALPSGSTQTSTPGNPGSFNVMWTPPMGSMGTIICYTATDSNGNTAPGQLCVEVQIGGGAVGDPHITSFWGCHIDAPKSEERAVLMTCANGDSLSVSYYEEFKYRIRTVWTVINGKKEHYKWNALGNSQRKTICGNEVEFHRYHAGINIAVKTIANRNIGGMFNDTSCYDDSSKAVFAHSGNSY